MSDARVALVSGASSGIGAAIAMALAESGFRVVLGARREDRIAEIAESIRGRGLLAESRPLDVTDAASIEAFFAFVDEAYGGCEAVVSNAGIGIPALLSDADPAGLREELEVNLLGAMLLAKRALGSLRGDVSDLVFVTSMNATVPRPGQAGYTASKAGLEGLARVLKMELEGTGTRSTIVRPGPTMTDFAGDWSDETLREVERMWRDWALWRHDRFMVPAAVASCVRTVVEADRYTHIDEIQVNPVAPKTGGTP